MVLFNSSKYARIAEKNSERLEVVFRFEEPERVPVVIGVGGPYYAWLFGYTFKEYYSSLKVMLDAQVMGLKWRLDWLQDDLADIGVHLDVGSIAEGIVFNCRIIMPDERDPWRSPWIVPRIQSLEDVDRLEVPDPEENPGVRAYYDRLDEFKKLARKEYGDIPISEGGLQIHPPVSAAGSLLGPQRLYAWLYRYPDEMHKLLRKLEKTYDVLQRYRYERMGGSMEAIGLSDDHSGYLTRRMYEKFSLPYNLRLFEKYGRRRRSLHMDSHMDHITDIIRDVYKVNSADVGVENNLGIIAEAFKGKVVFNGNANWRVLLACDQEKIRREVERCIYAGAPAGGYIFDNGGETYAGILPESLKYEVEFAKKIGAYPIKKKVK